MTGSCPAPLLTQASTWTAVQPNLVPTRCSQASRSPYLILIKKLRQALLVALALVSLNSLFVADPPSEEAKGGELPYMGLLPYTLAY